MAKRKESLPYLPGEKEGSLNPAVTYPSPDHPSRKRRRRYVSPAVYFISGVFFLAFTLLAAGWIVLNIHPGTVIKRAVDTKSSAELALQMSSLENNIKSNALSDLVYIKKIYTIPESDTVAPKPSSEGFGETYDPQEVQAVIDSASELLEGQSLVWNSDINFYQGSPISYYYDETILMITWKEVIGNTVFAFSEVKIADPSQLRRAIAGDSYSSSIQLKASDMSKAVNAVVAINGDFYAFRQIGVVVYRRELCRFSPSSLDTCFFTSSGNMLFSHAGELTDEEATKQYIRDNDILFSLSFGPILVENGQIRSTPSYPIGEIDNYYARSAIGKTDELHYLLMVTSTENISEYLDGIFAKDAAEIMYSRGCKDAYELDGGQTAVITVNGKPANGIVYGSERTMSDIVYFASALPGKED